MASAAGVPAWATRRHRYLVPRGLPSPAWGRGYRVWASELWKRRPQTSWLKPPLLRGARSTTLLKPAPPHTPGPSHSAPWLRLDSLLSPLLA